MRRPLESLEFVRSWESQVPRARAKDRPKVRPKVRGCVGTFLTGTRLQLTAQTGLNQKDDGTYPLGSMTI